MKRILIISVAIFFTSCVNNSEAKFWSNPSIEDNSSTVTIEISSTLLKPSVTSKWAITSSTSKLEIKICESFLNSSFLFSDSSEILLSYL